MSEIFEMADIFQMGWNHQLVRYINGDTIPIFSIFIPIGLFSADYLKVCL